MQKRDFFFLAVLAILMLSSYIAHQRIGSLVTNVSRLQEQNSSLSQELETVTFQVEAIQQRVEYNSDNGADLATSILEIEEVLQPIERIERAGTNGQSLRFVATPVE